MTPRSRYRSRERRAQPTAPADVRAYMQHFRADRPTASRVQIHGTAPRRPGLDVAVLVAGFERVEPGSRVALALADRLAERLDGSQSVTIHYRDTPAELARWVGDQLTGRTVVKRATTRPVARARPRRRRGGGA